METTAVSVVTIYGICTYRLHFQEGIRKKAKKKQECIPVGCVPPALCLGEGSLTETPMDRQPLWTQTSPHGQFRLRAVIKDTCEWTLKL